MDLFARTKNSLKAFISTQTANAFEVHSGFRIQRTQDTNAVRWNPGGRVTTWFPASQAQVLILVRGITEIEAVGYDTKDIQRAYNKLCDHLNAAYDVRFTVNKLIGGEIQMGFEGVPSTGFRE